MQQLFITSTSSTTATLSVLSSKRTVRSAQATCARRLRGGEAPYSRTPLRLQRTCDVNFGAVLKLETVLVVRPNGYLYIRLAVVRHNRSAKSCASRKLTEEEVDALEQLLK